MIATMRRLFKSFMRSVLALTPPAFAAELPACGRAGAAQARHPALERRGRGAGGRRATPDARAQRRRADESGLGDEAGDDLLGARAARPGLPLEDRGLRRRRRPRAEGLRRSEAQPGELLADAARAARRAACATSRATSSSTAATSRRSPKRPSTTTPTAPTTSRPTRCWSISSRCASASSPRPSAARCACSPSRRCPASRSSTRCGWWSGSLPRRPRVPRAHPGRASGRGRRAPRSPAPIPAACGERELQRRAPPSRGLRHRHDPPAMDGDRAAGGAARRARAWSRRGAPDLHARVGAARRGRCATSTSSPTT